MTAQSDPYSRVYWRFIREFPAIYDDKPTFGWWVTLLIIADGAHPSPAQLPHGVNRKSLDRLVEAGLVTLDTGFRYTIRGLSEERERRAEAGRPGGLASGRSRDRSTIVQRPFNGRATNVEPDETRRDETRKDETRRGTGLAPIRHVLEEQGLLPKKETA